MRHQLPASLTRIDSQALKGFAVLLMIMHHVLINDFYENPDAHVFTNVIAETITNRLMVLGKVCVGIFMFVTAYGYALKDRDWNYSFSHIKGLLKRYWVLLLAFIAIGLFVGNQPDFRAVLLNMFGFSSTYSCANWYVYFYIYAMLVLPAIAKLVNSYAIKTLVLSVALCGIAAFLMGNDNNKWLDIVRQCIFYTPVLVIGCYLARYGWSFIQHRFSTIELVLLLTLLLLAGCFSRDILGFCTFTIIVPALALIFSALLNSNSAGFIRKSLAYLGGISLYMWFIHAVFFSRMTRSLFQQSKLWPDNEILIFLLVFGCSLAVSMLLAHIEGAVVRK